MTTEATGKTLAALEMAFNRAIHGSPSALADCEAMANRCIRVDLTDLALTVSVVPVPGGVQLLAGEPEHADVRFEGTSWALMRAALADDGSRRGVTIDGDFDLGERFQGLLRKIRPDAEEALSRLVGDELAHAARAGLAGLADRLRGAAETLGRDLGEYFQYETGDLPTPDEVSDFLAEVDRLRDDVARLEARVRRLDRDRGGSEGPGEG